MTVEEYQRFTMYLESLPREIDTPLDSFGNNSVWNLAISYNEIYFQCDKIGLFDLKKVISVGSGNGKLELEMFYDVEDRHLAVENDEIICVDPNPFSHNDDNLYFKPKYSYVSELIISESDMVNDCGLMLIWPYPSEEGKYAMKAIEMLNPKKVVILYEDSGCAGTEELRRFIYEVKNGKNERWSYDSLISREYESTTRTTLYFELICITRNQ